MPVCSILGCSMRKLPNQPPLSLHRLPRREPRRKKWLEVIGGNLKRSRKNVYICSLHFSEDCFNKTLEVVRLRDEAVPSKSKIVLPEPSQNNVPTLILSGHDYLRSDLPCVKVATINNASGPVDPLKIDTPPPRVTNVAIDAVTPADPLNIDTASPRVSAAAINNASAPVNPLRIDTSPPLATDAKYSASVFETANKAMAQTLKIQKLEKRNILLQKKVKKMQETIRRRNKKMAEYKNIIKELWETIANDENLTLNRAELENLNQDSENRLQPVMAQEACQAPSRKPVEPELAKRQATLASKIETFMTIPNITTDLTLQLENGNKTENVPTKIVRNRKLFTFSCK